MKIHPTVKLILRLLVGLTFVASAILKLISLDEFEIYVYSFEIFNFVTVALLSRLLIAAEFILGVCIASRIFYKYAWWLTCAMLVFFTLFLAYTAIFRSDDNCHCFGNAVELGAVESIIKNIVLLVLLLLVRKERDLKMKYLLPIKIVLFVVAFAVPFLVFPPDILYNKLKSEKENINTIEFEKAKTDTAFSKLQIEKGNYMLAFVASGCKYCKLSAQKIHSIFLQNTIDSSKLKFVIWGGDEQIEIFKELGGREYEYVTVHPAIAINVTFGKFPTFALVKDGKLEKAFDYRGIDEAEIVGFLK